MIKTRFVRRALALALLLVMLFGFARAASTYVSYHRSRTVQILEQRHALGRLIGLAERLDEVDRLATTNKPDAFSKLMFEAPTTPLLIAQLQKQLQTIAMANQAQFIRASELPARQQQGLTRGGLKLEVSGTIESLTKTIKAIESAVPTLTIEAATIAADSATQSNSNRIPQLAMSLEIVAVGRIDSSSTATEPK